MRSVVSVCPSVRFFPLYLINQMTADLDFFACAWVVTTARRGLKVRVIGQGRTPMQKCVCYMAVASYQHCLMAVVVGFQGDFVGFELARRGVRRGAAESSTCRCGDAVGLTSILDREQFL